MLILKSKEFRVFSTEARNSFEINEFNRFDRNSALKGISMKELIDRLSRWIRDCAGCLPFERKAKDFYLFALVHSTTNSLSSGICSGNLFILSLVFMLSGIEEGEKVEGNGGRSYHQGAISFSFSRVHPSLGDIGSSLAPRSLFILLSIPLSFSKRFLLFLSLSLYLTTRPPTANYPFRTTNHPSSSFCYTRCHPSGSACPSNTVMWPL